MTSLTLTISKISCNHCINAIKNEILEMEGVSSAEGNAEQKTVTIVYQEPATGEKIRAVLDEIGYPAEK